MSATEVEQPQNKVYIKQLNWNTTSKSLREAVLGAVKDVEVVDVDVKTERETGKSKGYGFITFRTHEQAERAIQEITANPELDGRRVSVAFAYDIGSRPSYDKRSEGGYGGRSYGGDEGGRSSYGGGRSYGGGEGGRPPYGNGGRSYGDSGRSYGGNGGGRYGGSDSSSRPPYSGNGGGGRPPYGGSGYRSRDNEGGNSHSRDNNSYGTNGDYEQ